MRKDFACGDWLLTPQRAAIHLPSSTAVVADLHLGYGHARRRQGEAIPDWGLEEVRGILGPLTSRPDVRGLVIAGDLVENGAGLSLITAFVAWLRDTGVELLGIVPGNHDRGLDRHTGGLPLYPQGMMLGRWRVIHGDGPRRSGPTVQGHDHPCLRWGRELSVPCYLIADDHLILPACSADAAGVNVLGNRRWGRYRCCVAAADRVLDFGVVARLRRGPKSVRKERGQDPSIHGSCPLSFRTLKTVGGRAQ
jgi:metallophosphoesterase superfamily enzyme